MMKSNTKRNQGIALWLAFLFSALFLCTPALAKVEEGREVWFFGSEYDEYIYRDALVLSNGNLLLCCGTNRSQYGSKGSDGEFHGWLLCLKPDGSVAWEVHLEEPGVGSRVNRPIELSDGRIAVYYATSTRQNHLNEGFQYFSLDGESLGYAESEPGTHLSGLNLFAAEDGYIRTRPDPELGQPGFFWAEYITLTGEVLWQIPTQQYMHTQGVLVTEEGFLLFEGGRQVEPETFGASLYMVSKESGEVLWRTDLEKQPNFIPRKIIATEDGGFLTVGGTEREGSFEAEGIRVIKWNSRGAQEWVQNYTFDEKYVHTVVPVEWKNQYVFVYPAKTNTRLGLLVTDKQGQEEKRGLLPYKDGDFLNLEPVVFGGQPWLFGDGEQSNGNRDVIIMKPDWDALINGL